MLIAKSGCMVYGTVSSKVTVWCLWPPRCCQSIQWKRSTSLRSICASAFCLSACFRQSKLTWVYMCNGWFKHLSQVAVQEKIICSVTKRKINAKTEKDVYPNWHKKWYIYLMNCEGYAKIRSPRYFSWSKWKLFVKRKITDTFL